MKFIFCFRLFALNNKFHLAEIIFPENSFFKFIKSANGRYIKTIL